MLSLVDWQPYREEREWGDTSSTRFGARSRVMGQDEVACRVRARRGGKEAWDVDLQHDTLSL